MSALSLHDVHARASARFGELNGREVVLDFGDALAEYAAAREGAALFDLSSRQRLALTGPDRVSFLHGMVTNDINKLADGAACDVAMLTQKGAMVADGRVLKLADALWLDVEPGLLEKVREFLDRYLISEEVELADVSDTHGHLALHGPRALEVLGAALGVTLSPLEQNAHLTREFEGAHVHLLGSNRLTGQGVELLVPVAQLESLWTKLVASGARPAGHEARELLRIEAGVPRYGQDLVDTTIPLEADLTHAISYNKGCYIGQEVIARATFRGHMNRKLTGLILGEHEAEAGTLLFVGDRKVGWLTSIARSPKLGQRIALGYVHRDHLTPGTELRLGESDQTVRTHALPFV